MGKENRKHKNGTMLKKGKRGAAAQYITRQQALKRLGIKLPEFRKLCILKGIYPREPKRKLHGKDKTYFHIKDIRFLSHEPLLAKYADDQVFLRKYKKLVGRHNIEAARKFEGQRPTQPLEHIVRERYPTFVDALRDLDDAISMISLFQALPSDRKAEISSKMIQDSTDIYNNFMLYVSNTHSLRKVFASLKGYYYQAEVMGTPVTWLEPHKFSQKLPGEVDFRVMNTFLDFYHTLVKFCNFKLYTSNGMVYPPVKNATAAEAPVGAAALKVSGFENSEEGKKMFETEKEARDAANCFKGLKVFVSREVPFGPVHFVLRAGGAEVGWEGAGSPFKGEDDVVTHVVVDRPPEHLEMIEGKEYVQPQWVLDSFNCKMKLPLMDYAPGKTPPPHLSPFINDEAEGYVPKQREVLNALIDEKKRAEPDMALESDDEEASDAEDKFQAELAAERAGKSFAEFNEEKNAVVVAAKKAQDEADEEAPKVLTKKERRAAEELERQKALMSKKHKRLLQRIEYTKQTKEDDNLALRNKRRKQDKKVKKTEKKA